MLPAAALVALPRTDKGTIPADKALATVTSNYAASHDNTDRLTKLQAWLKGILNGQ